MKDPREENASSRHIRPKLETSDIGGGGPWEGCGDAVAEQNNPKLQNSVIGGDKDRVCASIVKMNAFNLNDSRAARGNHLGCFHKARGAAAFGLFSPLLVLSP